MFALYRVHVLAPQHPEWQSQEPFKSVLSNDPAALGKFTEQDWFEIVVATHSGMSTERFQDWSGNGWKRRKTLGSSGLSPTLSISRCAR